MDGMDATGSVFGPARGKAVHWGKPWWMLTLVTGACCDRGAPNRVPAPTAPSSSAGIIAIVWWAHVYGQPVAHGPIGGVAEVFELPLPRQPTNGDKIVTHGPIGAYPGDGPTPTPRWGFWRGKDVRPVSYPRRSLRGIASSDTPPEGKPLPSHPVLARTWFMAFWGIPAQVPDEGPGVGRSESPSPVSSSESVAGDADQSNLFREKGSEQGQAIQWLEWSSDQTHLFANNGSEQQAEPVMPPATDGAADASSEGEAVPTPATAPVKPVASILFSSKAAFTLPANATVAAPSPTTRKGTTTPSGVPASITLRTATTAPTTPVETLILRTRATGIPPGVMRLRPQSAPPSPGTSKTAVDEWSDGCPKEAQGDFP
jgi:hypothetical protein